MSVFGAALNQVRAVDESRPVTLVFNEITREIPYSLARGRTLSQLYTENSSSLGVDPSRVTNYVLNNEVVPGDYQVRPGEVVRASVNSESKG